MYIPTCKYQYKLLSSPLASAICVVIIAHRNLFFCLSQLNKSSMVLMYIFLDLIGQRSEIFSKNSYIGDSGDSLRAFPLRTNLKLHNIPLTEILVWKVIINLDSAKAFGRD